MSVIKKKLFQTSNFWVFSRPFETSFFSVFSRPFETSLFSVFSRPFETSLFSVFSRPFETFHIWFLFRLCFETFFFVRYLSEDFFCTSMLSSQMATTLYFFYNSLDQTDWNCRIVSNIWIFLFYLFLFVMFFPVTHPSTNRDEWCLTLNSDGHRRYECC